MDKHPEPKPDDRSDNVERLQENIDHTVENMDEAREYLSAHEGELSREEVERIRSKNQKREEALEGFRDEIQDEARHAQKRDSN